MRLFPDIKDTYDSLISTLDSKMWVKGTFSASGVQPFENVTKRDTGAWNYDDSPNNYGERCTGVCAVGAIELYLGAGSANQPIRHFDPDESQTLSAPKLQPADDRALDWYDSVLVVTGVYYSNRVFNQWKGFYFSTKLLAERNKAKINTLLARDVEEWNEIPHMNDHPACKLEDVQDLLGVIDIYPPFRTVARLRKEPTIQQLDKAWNLYDHWVKPYLDAGGEYSTSGIEADQYVEWLKKANIL